MVEDFFIQYFATVTGGITLGVLGYGVYRTYATIQSKNSSTKQSQENKKGDNVVQQQIGTQYNYNGGVYKDIQETVEKYDS